MKNNLMQRRERTKRLMTIADHLSVAATNKLGRWSVQSIESYESHYMALPLKWKRFVNKMVLRTTGKPVDTSSFYFKKLQ